MLKPLYARVLLKREELKTGSIIVPEEAKARHAPTKGVVIAKGPDADDAVEIGKTYLWGAFAGAWLNKDGTPYTGGEDQYYVCADEDLIAEVVDD